MELTMRMCQEKEDYWRMRAFLREVFLLNERRERGWQVARLDYWRWHGIENGGWPPSMDDVTFIWETAKGQIAAVLNPEGPGEAFLQVHPGLRTPELEEEMIAIAEERLAVLASSGQRKLRIWANEHDGLRQEILVRRGYAKGEWPEYRWRRSLDVPIPDVPVAAGYTVRALGDVEELSARSWASWKAFHPRDPDERYEGWDWYLNVQRIPLYRRDLDIVAVAPTGEVASFCTAWYDDVTRTGCFDPVGTMPAHQRRGLGKAVMCEGLRRLKRLGATMAYVGGFTVAANALYASVMSSEYELVEPWKRAL
jgi:mycothiol synthase